MQAEAEVQVGRPARWLDRAGLGLAALLVATVWLLVGLGIRAEFRRAADQAAESGAILARTLEAEIAGRLRTIETILRYGAALQARDPAGFTVRDWIGIDPPADLVQAAIIGPDGFVHSILDGVLPAPVDLRDRPYVAAILGNPAQDRLQISAPLTDRVSDRPTINLARPLRDAGGALAGIIMLAVDADSFSRLYRRLDLQGGTVGLVGDDGIIRARVPGPDNLLGLRLPDATIEKIRATTGEAHWRDRSVVDGIDRFFLYRRVQGYPLVVTIGTDADVALALARRDRAKLLAVGGVVTLLILGACLGVAHVRRRDRRARAQLEAVVAHVGQGIMMIDPQRRLAVVNRRAIELLGLPPGLAVPGTPISSVVAWQEATGEFGGGPAPHVHVDSSGGPDRPPVVTLRARPDGTELEIRTAHAADGSHVRTFTDVTAPRRAAAAIAVARDQALAAEAALAAALENVPHGVMLVGPDDRILLCNQAAIDLAGVPPDLARPGTPIARLIEHQVAAGEIEPIEGPIPEAWAAMRAQGLDGRVYQRVKPDGRVIEVRSNFLADGRFIRTYTDVTAHHAALRAEAAARDQAQAAQAALAAAFENVPHGVLLIGADQRVQVINANAVRLIDLPPDLAQPGAAIQDILAFQLERGDFATTPAVAAAARATLAGPEPPLADYERRLRDGRVMDVRTTHLPDGRVLRTFTDVTARHQALQAEAAARAALVAAFENAPLGILLVDAAQQVEFINGMAVDLLDLPPDLARPGTPALDIVRLQLARDDLAAVPDILAEAAAAAATAPEPEAREAYERPTRDGRMMEVRTRLLPDGRTIRTYADVTGRHAALAAQEAARAALSAAFENAPLGIALVDADGRVEVVNSLTGALLDLPPELTRPGTAIREILRFQQERGDFAAAPEALPLAGAGLVRGAAEHPPYVRATRDGRMLEVRVRFLEDGRSVRTFTDVTARHAVLQAQEAARLAAEAALRSRTEFLAIVSHELRTPLNAVIGLSDVLLLHEPRPDQVEDLRMVRESGRQLLGLVDDILDVSRLERGRVTLREVVFDPRETLRAMAWQVAPRARAKGLDFVLELDSGLPEAVLGDEDRLRQVLLKLLDNALKFTPSGRIALGAVAIAGSAETGAGAAGGWQLAITIADTGIGITPEAGARLFEPFTQGDSSTARQFGGLGLGLAVCRLLLESMGGSIAVESAAGAGSIFRVALPLRAVPEGPSAAPATPLRVLVAEDIAANRAVAVALLQRLGHRPEAVEDGAAAVAAMRDRAYDLVLMDIMMPGMDGIAATRAIRALPGPAARVPIIAVTADASPEAEAKCRAAGMDRFEAKPLQTERLRTAIAAVMARP
ncbi:response regulator [Dankookia rubra]|uniref:histidine kinase n=1 Tax=Dankookia rubra TaxID=1442381 RepID=A0A4V3AA89_9PROT|nr:PAS-domain containing protein [Dankookia rubra]TDH62215.1 response regulator [Dankookia rubra]